MFYLEKRKIVAYNMLVKLVDLSITLKHSGRHMALSRLVTLIFSSLPDLDIEAHKLYDRGLRPYIDSKLIILGIYQKSICQQGDSIH